MQRENQSEKLLLGAKMPDFSLLNVDGKIVNKTFFSGARAALVAFSCNHCPYVKGSEEMLVKIARKFAEDGLRVVAISSNDAVQYPEDGYDKMQEKAQTMNLPYPYLYDETQQVAKAFDAACTPEFFLFNAAEELVYHGTINDSPRDPAKVTKDYLSEAIKQVLEGQKPEPAFVRPLGCSIKWKL